MAIQATNTIKQWFRTGLKPTQQQFWDWLDSFRHKDDKIPAADVEGIDELLLAKADKSVLDNHLSSTNANAHTADQITETSDRKFQTATQDEFNDATSSIQGQFTDLILDMSDKASVSYVNEQDAILNDKITSLAKATCHTGITDTGDTVDIIQLTNTTFKIAVITSAIFHEKFYEPGAVAIKSFPETTHNVSIVPTTQNGTSVWCVGKDYDGNIQFSSSSFILNTNVVGIGYIYILRTAGVNTFLFSGLDPRNVLVIPDIAGVSAFDRSIFGISSSVRVFANTGNVMTLNNGIGGKVKRMSVNWIPGTRNEFNDERNVSATSLISFLRLNPSTVLSTTPPSSVTSLDVTTYWNGTSMIPLTGNNYASVQAVYCSSKGGIVILAGEQEFSSFQLAKDSMWQVKFTSLLPSETFAEIARIVAVKNANVISDTSKVFIDPVSSSGSGGSAGGPDATKEDTINKTDEYISNPGSSVKFLSVKGVENFWTWIKTQSQTINGAWNFNNVVNFFAGTATTPSIIIPNGALTTTPQNGAVERDNNGVLWETHLGVRNKLATAIDVSSSVTGFVNNTALQELGGVDKMINSIRIGKGNGNKDNIVLGNNALNSNTTGSGNAAIGRYALYSNISGTSNTAIGYALVSNTTGSGNIAIGENALLQNTIGYQNCAIGGSALGNITGNGNVGIGNVAGYYDKNLNNLTSATDSLFIGNRAKANSSGETNQIVIGNNAVGGGNNTVTIGDDSIVRTYLNGTVNMLALNVFIDNASAIAGGKITGDLYRKPTGELMIVF